MNNLTMKIVGMIFSRGSIWLSLFLISTYGNANISIPNDINTTVQNYYKAELRGDWATVYSYRTSQFKKYVMKDEFVRVMAEMNTGWTLLSYDITSFQLNGDKITMKIEFKEVPPVQFWLGSGLSNQKSLVFIGIAVWIKENNEWRCKQSPSRGHLPYME